MASSPIAVRLTGIAAIRTRGLPWQMIETNTREDNYAKVARRRFVLNSGSIENRWRSSHHCAVTTMTSFSAFVLLVGACAGAAGCAAPRDRVERAPAGQISAVVDSVLGDTEWRLVEIQSLGDDVASQRPADPSRYTMRLSRDGSVAMVLNCNRGNGTWKAIAATDRISGSFEIGPLAITAALCPAPSLDERLAAQLPFVRGYLLRDGRLHLSLMADGGVLVWEPADIEVRFLTAPDPALETAIRGAVLSRSARGAIASEARYVYNRLDLDGDGRFEVLVYVLGPEFCGTGGCSLMIFRRVADGFVLVKSIPAARPPVIVSPVRTAGWHDLLYQRSGGGAQATWVRLTFNGVEYVPGAQRPVGPVPPEGRRFLTGDLAYETAIPLPRR